MTWSRVPARDQGRVHLDLAADDERVVVGDDRPELLGAQPVALIDVVASAKQIDAFAGDGLRDEDPHAPTGAASTGVSP